MQTTIRPVRRLFCGGGHTLIKFVTKIFFTRISQIRMVFWTIFGRPHPQIYNFCNYAPKARAKNRGFRFFQGEIWCIFQVLSNSWHKLEKTLHILKTFELEADCPLCPLCVRAWLSCLHMWKALVQSKPYWTTYSNGNNNGQEIQACFIVIKQKVFLHFHNTISFPNSSQISSTAFKDGTNMLHWTVKLSVNAFIFTPFTNLATNIKTKPSFIFSYNNNPWAVVITGVRPDILIFLITVRHVCRHIVTWPNSKVTWTSRWRLELVLKINQRYFLPVHWSKSYDCNKMCIV